MNLSLLIGNRAELLMTSFFIGILLILFTPIPERFLDVLLIINFSWALMMLVLTFYIEKPLEFSTFPSLLLISTLFRLALNISATRLILSTASAGKVIESIGEHVIQGNYVMGLVVFLILIIVQYIVVTNGAQRVAEVAARFTLDSMPGKQMSIDADLNMGLISQQTAMSRRDALEKEANFYGAMDGASKFVKGDAIAGILIILVDVLGGFAIGLAQKGMTLTESMQTYSLLTVGDGLITQIPAVIISTATGIIVTRAATDAQLGREVAKQITAQPKSLVMVCFALCGMLFLGGIPTLPVLLILILVIGVIAFIIKQPGSDQAVETSTKNSTNTLYETIKIHPIQLAFSLKLYQSMKPLESELLSHIQDLRRSIAVELGFIFPAVTFIKDPQLDSQQYQILIHATPLGTGHLELTNSLAINAQDSTISLPGRQVRDPTYGLPAVWIKDNQVINAQRAGLTVIPSMKVLITHLNDVLNRHADMLLTRDQVDILIHQEGIKSIALEVIPDLLSLGAVRKILQQLLRERVSIRDLETIFDVLADKASPQIDVDELTELVRQGLAHALCRPLLSEKEQLFVLTLCPKLENQLNESLHNKQLGLSPNYSEKILHAMAVWVGNMLKDNKRPVLLCSVTLRRHLYQLCSRAIPLLSILSLNEIPLTIQVESYGVIQC